MLRLRALAVNAHLAFADHALDVREAQPRKLGFQKAIDAHAGFVGGDRDGLHRCRHRRCDSPSPVTIILRRARMSAPLSVFTRVFGALWARLEGGTTPAVALRGPLRSSLKMTEGRPLRSALIALSVLLVPRPSR